MDLRQINEIRRYDDCLIIGTDLDPIEDITNLISSLKSTGFTSDILKEVHGYSDSSEIKKTSKLVALHINSAIGLADQAFDGPPEASFLPLYYSTLNLSKVYLLTRGFRLKLQKNRWHGAQYDESEMRKKFMNEKIIIHKDGTIPLIYKATGGNKMGKKRIKIKLEDIYKNISSINAEYSTITKLGSGLFAHQIKIIEDNENGHYLKIINKENRFIKKLPSPKSLQAFSNLNIVTDDNGKKYFESNRIKGDFENAKENLIKSVNRNLISDRHQDHDIIKYWVGYTPISSNKHVFNEDLCIMLAYFHLSNIVRYNPEHLYKLMDSKYWPILLSLRKHGFLRFQKLMWGNYLKKSFDIS